MNGPDVLAKLLGPPEPHGTRALTPTDVAQFVRLEQCERYLRLQLYQRTHGERFLREYGVAPQAITPLLTRSGERFEREVEAAIQAHGDRVVDTRAAQPAIRAGDHNDLVLRLARELSPGEAVTILQPRLRAVVEGWLLRGDIDILRLQRDQVGRLDGLIVDMKSSTSAKVEHRLQVAFYHEMLSTLFHAAAMPFAALDMGILYRGVPGSAQPVGDEEARQLEAQHHEARALFGVDGPLFERVPDPDSYRDAVRDLVLGPSSSANRVLAMPFEAVPYHLSYKCDGCLFNEFCMKWSAEREDLSLLPHLTADEKNVLSRAGVTSVGELARLKVPSGPGATDLIPAPHAIELARRLGATWPVGPRLDELIHRARAYRKWKREPLESLRFIPNKGYESLPYSGPEHNPNLIRVYIDAQHDYLNDRVYLVGALVVACVNGQDDPDRRRSIVRLTPGPPDEATEQALFVSWIHDTFRAIGALAAPNATGEPRAPIHLIFFNRFGQHLLLAGLSRHFAAITNATPLYDFVTQLAAYDSPVVSFLETEIREHKNYPMVCQSLQAVAAYLGFDWNTPAPYRQLFRARLFDFWGKLEPFAPDDEAPGRSRWFTNRARFNSQLPLEYAYAAWGDLAPIAPGARDDYAPYRVATPELVRGFQARRLEALEQIAREFTGNKQTQQREFDLRHLSEFESQARTLAQALDEFITIERHVELAAWKSARLAPPERRALTGDTLIVRYLEEDQAPGVAALNREHQRRDALGQRYEAEWRQANPDAKRKSLPKEQRDASTWDRAGLRFRLRLDTSGLDGDLHHVLGQTTFGEGDRLVLYTRQTVDSRLPVADQTPFTPTPKQLLYGQRVDLRRLLVDRDAGGRAVRAWAEVEFSPYSGSRVDGFVFPGGREPLVADETYTLDPDPNDWSGAHQRQLVQALQAGAENAVYQRLDESGPATAEWPILAQEGQARFMAGLDAFHAAGHAHDFEPAKRLFIGAYGNSPTLLVQGPPGTGKSYTTAFALLARAQGALAAGSDFRAMVACSSHAATDVLLRNVLHAREQLRHWAAAHPALFQQHFDDRLLDIPLFRLAAKNELPAGIIALPSKDGRPKGEPDAAARLLAASYSITGGTPGGIRRALHERWPKELFAHQFCDCLVLDEASRTSLPEAIMAALPLKPRGQLIVVGDHRQMPPIVKHDWAHERRRTFQQFRSYASLFVTLLEQVPRGVPIVRFAESFRLHADVAEFLRREVYARDGIAFHSRRVATLPPLAHPDPFVASVLMPEQTIVVVVHDEAASQQRNAFEQALITPVLEALGRARSAGGLGLSPRDGLGAVVPHRAQRAALRDALPLLVVTDPETGAVTLSAIDTVERFQGGEREVILIGATESDRQYILTTSNFLLDPRRLTVALSRAKQKIVLVASRSVFALFSADEETFVNAGLWKNLLRRTATTLLWAGHREGHRVEVWGNQPVSPLGSDEEDQASSRHRPPTVAR